jgi:hypothetical protein
MLKNLGVHLYCNSISKGKHGVFYSDCGECII